MDPILSHCGKDNDGSYCIDIFASAIKDLTARVNEIELRNKEKDIDKKWESSILRVIVIMILTYCCIYGYLRFLGTSNAELAALVPTVGFNLSTWSLRCK